METDTAVIVASKNKYFPLISVTSSIICYGIIF